MTIVDRVKKQQQQQNHEFQNTVKQYELILMLHTLVSMPHLTLLCKQYLNS